MTLQNTHFQLPQGQLAYLKNQHQDQQPELLAIHGWLDNANSFQNLVQQLPQYNWTCIDLPGHGHSFHRPPYAFYHFIDWVSDLADFIAAKYDKPITLVGHSLGGMLSTVFAGLYPKLVDKVILLDAAGLVTQAPEDGVEKLRLALESRKQLVAKSDQKPVKFEAVVRARAMAGQFSDAIAEQLVSRNLQMCDGCWYWRSDNRLRAQSPIRMHATQAKSVIESIQAPVLIVLAQQGYPEIRQNFERYQANYRDLTYATVAGGHHCHMENPDQCAQLIAKFLK